MKLQNFKLDTQIQVSSLSEVSRQKGNNPVPYLEPCQTSMMELFCKNS